MAIDQGGPSLVTRNVGVAGMGDTVGFDDKLRLHTSDVCVVWADRILTAEVIAALTELVEDLPELSFRWAR